jgi:hypothetical protein
LRTGCSGKYLDLKDGSWIKLHNIELQGLYSLSNVLRAIKSMNMRWVRHVARMGRGEVFTRFWFGGPKERVHWEDLGVGGNVTLKWTLGR